MMPMIQITLGAFVSNLQMASVWLCVTLVAALSVQTTHKMFGGLSGNHGTIENSSHLVGHPYVITELLL